MVFSSEDCDRELLLCMRLVSGSAVGKGDLSESGVVEDNFAVAAFISVAAYNGCMDRNVLSSRK